MMQRGTFIYRENRHGVPWQAVEYICEHRYESQTCGVDPICGPVGQAMLLWWNSRPEQFKAREVVRTRMINGQ